jgi:uncharacterized protein YvpB
VYPPVAMAGDENTHAAKTLLLQQAKHVQAAEVRAMSNSATMTQNQDFGVVGSPLEITYERHKPSRSTQRDACDMCT